MPSRDFADLIALLAFVFGLSWDLPKRLRPEAFEAA